MVYIWNKNNVCLCIAQHITEYHKHSPMKGSQQVTKVNCESRLKIEVVLFRHHPYMVNSGIMAHQTSHNGNPFHEQFMSWLPKFLKTSNYSYITNNDQIRSQFCTCHDSSAVVACAKMRPDWMITIEMRWYRIFTRFQWGAHKLLCNGPQKSVNCIQRTRSQWPGKGPEGRLTQSVVHHWYQNGKTSPWLRLY